MRPSSFTAWGSLASLTSSLLMLIMTTTMIVTPTQALRVSVSVELPIFVSKITDLSPAEYERTVCQRKEYRLGTTFLDPTTGQQRYLAELPKLQHNAVLYGSPTGLLGLFVKDDVVRAKKKWYHSLVPRNLKDGHWESRLVQQSAVLPMGDGGLSGHHDHLDHHGNHQHSHQHSQQHPAATSKWERVVEELQLQARHLTNAYRYRSLAREAASFQHYYQRTLTLCRSLARSWSPNAGGFSCKAGGNGDREGARQGDVHGDNDDNDVGNRNHHHPARTGRSSAAVVTFHAGTATTVDADAAAPAAPAATPLHRSLPSMMLVDRSVECTEEFFANFAKHQAPYTGGGGALSATDGTATLDADASSSICSPLLLRTGLLKTHALGKCAGRPFDPLRRHAFLPPRTLFAHRRPYIFHWDTPLYRNPKFTRGLGGFLGSLLQPPVLTGRLRVNLHIQHASDFTELLELLLKRTKMKTTTTTTSSENYYHHYGGSFHALLCSDQSGGGSRRNTAAAATASCLVYEGLAQGLEHLRAVTGSGGGMGDGGVSGLSPPSPLSMMSPPSSQPATAPLSPTVQTLVLLLALAVYRAIEYDSPQALEWKPSGNGFPTVDRGGLYIGTSFAAMLQSLSPADREHFLSGYPQWLGAVLGKMAANRNVRHLARHLHQHPTQWLDRIEVARVPMRTLVDQQLFPSSSSTSPSPSTNTGDHHHGSNHGSCGADGGEYAGWRIGVYAPYYRVYRTWKQILLPLLSSPDADRRSTADTATAADTTNTPDPNSELARLLAGGRS